MTLTITKEGIKFSASGDIGSGAVTIKNGSGGTIDEREEDEDTTTVIHLNRPVNVVLSLKYLVQFTKATPLSKRVTLGVSSDVPMLVEYKVGEAGYIRYYLAPKMDEEE